MFSTWSFTSTYRHNLLWASSSHLQDRRVLPEWSREFLGALNSLSLVPRSRGPSVWVAFIANRQPASCFRSSPPLKASITIASSILALRPSLPVQDFLYLNLLPAARAKAGILHHLSSFFHARSFWLLSANSRFRPWAQFHALVASWADFANLRFVWWRFLSQSWILPLKCLCQDCLQHCCCSFCWPTWWTQAHY